MKHCSKIVTFAVLIWGVAFAAVLKFDSLKMSEHLKCDVQDIINLVMKPHTLSQYMPSEIYEKKGLDPSTRLMSYRWDNCGNKAEENLIIHDVQFSPDPFVFPGKFSVSFNIVTKLHLSYDIKIVVKMTKKYASTWIKIPCIGMIGSCTYSDVCSCLDRITCPPALVKASIPCRCPFEKGTYVLPMATFEVSASLVPPGDYHIRANLTHDRGSVDAGCYDIYASFG